MPAVSKKQQEFMAIRLQDAREGKNTTSMSIPQLEDFAATPRKGLPEQAKPARKFGQLRV